MKSILENLFEGNIKPEALITPTNPEYTTKIDEISSDMESLKETESAECFEKVYKIVESQVDLNSMVTFSYFSHGFRLAAVLMAEVFITSEGLIAEVDKSCDPEIIKKIYSRIAGDGT